MNILNDKKPSITAHSSESNERIFSFLQSNPVGVLATVDPNLNPHAVVIYFSVKDDFTITFTTKRDTKKHDNLLRNNHVMLVSYEASSQTTAQVTGTVEEIMDEGESNAAFTNMLRASARTSESGVPPISKLYAGHYVSYRITPVLIRMAVFIRPDPGGYDMFETINF